MITPFLQDLAESRIFKDSSSIKGKSAEQIAELVFLVILLLEILRTEDRGTARDYVDATLKFNSFDSIKASGTDLHNLISVLNHQGDYDDQIHSDYNIAIPYLQLRRYLKDYSLGPTTGQGNSMDRQFLIKLEKYLKVTKYSKFRRIIGDWWNASHDEKRDTIAQLRRLFSSLAVNIDIWQDAKKEL